MREADITTFPRGVHDFAKVIRRIIRDRELGRIMTLDDIQSAAEKYTDLLGWMKSTCAEADRRRITPKMCEGILHNWMESSESMGPLELGAVMQSLVEAIARHGDPNDIPLKRIMTAFDRISKSDLLPKLDRIGKEATPIMQLPYPKRQLMNELNSMPDVESSIPQYEDEDEALAHAEQMLAEIKARGDA
ncbi:hypothetical protein PISL3812_07326 [Talaromyces islandicus]|uniref:Uncharacterized protein n=1 Tax=Talaromyces islandicus TaxID=28573 RepID=A0A0U1M3W2_TALIS|nr:hypothetical protein PISL3812_07326 [Talaromyces islandicus]